MDIKVKTDKTGIQTDKIVSLRGQAAAIKKELMTAERPFTDWAPLPGSYDREELENILDTAAEIKKKCSLLIVIGIGGSYLGARAVLSALDREYPGCPEVMFAGFNISAAYHSKVLKKIKENETCICVISKSGGTTESLTAFSILKEALTEKYGKAEAGRRIYAITGQKGILRDEADENGYVTFPVPENIGGRYSVLSPVGLLPLAAAGADVKALMEGAAEMMNDPGWSSTALDYAIVRRLMDENNKKVEIFEWFEPAMEYFSEWLKQLFGESEGKDGRGIFPASLSFTKDLHSIGQFLQEGSPVFFETMLRIEKSAADITVPESAGELLGGKSMNDINRCVMTGVAAAHEKGGVPFVTIDIPEIDERHVGGLIWFFEMSCAISATMLGVDPFNQPGVENYKTETKEEILKI